MKDYTFDIDAEAAALKSELAANGKNFWFFEADVDASSMPAKVSARALGKTPLHAHAARKLITSRFKANPFETSYEMTFMDAEVAVLRKQEALTDSLGPANADLMKLFFLYHETAHGLIKAGPEIDDFHPARENAADAYAALRLLQRFGDDAADFISMVSWLRIFGAVNKGITSHLTSASLDQIVADSKTEDFTQLDFEKTVRRAARYARNWTPTQTMLEKAAPVFERKWDFDGIASTSLSSPDPFIFYIGAKYFNPLAAEHGALRNGQPMNLAIEKRRAFAAQTAETLAAKNLTLADIFDDARKRPASPALNDVISVRRPAGQKQFSFRA